MVKSVQFVLEEDKYRYYKGVMERTGIRTWEELLDKGCWHLDPLTDYQEDF